jgi:hypothetical protein
MEPVLARMVLSRTWASVLRLRNTLSSITVSMYFPSRAMFPIVARASYSWAKKGGKIG